MSERLHLAERRFETPVGPMRALASEVGLCALEFDSAERQARLAARRARRFPPHDVTEGDAPALAAVAQWLEDYFAGRRADPWTVPLVFYGSVFERAVWRRLLEIPAGTTSTYGAIARALQVPNGSRAVGLANGANPLALIVACHRVIGSTGALTGYGGGLDRKRWLLDHEARYWGVPAPARLF